MSIDIPNPESFLDEKGRMIQKSDVLLRNGRYTLLSGYESRIVLKVSSHVMQAIGGRDVLTRELYPAIFDGSHPAWGINGNDGSYLIELGYRRLNNDQLIAFIDAIDARAIPKTVMATDLEDHVREGVTKDRRNIGWKILAYLRWK